MSQAVPDSAPMHPLPLIGLYWAAIFAICCNAYLDIEHGSFNLEVTCWAIWFAWPLYLAWLQREGANEWGKTWQRGGFVLALVIFIGVILPIWGPIRASVYGLALVLGVFSINCINQRRLFFCLTITAVLAITATLHYRADWSMVFFLLPYTIAVIFTLVTQQMQHRFDDANPYAGKLRQGQGMAILSAGVAIFALAWLLYLLTPQVSQPNLYWKTNINGEMKIVTAEELKPGKGQKGQGGQGKPGGTEQGAGGEAQAPKTAAERGAMALYKAAERKGMPQWQSEAMQRLGQAMEKMGEAEQEAEAAFAAAQQAMRQALHQLANLLQHPPWWLQFLLAVLLTLLVLLWDREIRQWLRSYVDYFYLVYVLPHTPLARWLPRTADEAAYFAALQRLLAWHKVPVTEELTLRTYLQRAVRQHRGCKKEISRLTLLYEEALYAPPANSQARRAKMLRYYQTLFSKLKTQQKI